MADVLGYIQPDFTLIEGIEATIYGHYPVTAFADECVLPFKVLIGSDNVVAADIVGAKLFGLTVEKVEHLRLAIERGYSQGVSCWDDIDVEGDISDFTQTYPTDLLQRFPDDVKVIKGKKMLCREGCKNNPLTVLQVLAYDYGGKGGWTLVMGKGHSAEDIDAITGKVLIAGRCAIKETAETLIKRLGKKNVYLTGHCNDLCATVNAMCHLMKVDPLRLAPMPFFTSLWLLATARLKGTRANIPNPFAHLIKTAYRP